MIVLLGIIQNDQFNAMNFTDTQNPVVPAVDNRVVNNRKRAVVKKAAEAQKNVIDKPKSDNVTAKTSDEGEKIESVSGRESREGSSRKEVKTLTSILTARSKVCIFEHSLKDSSLTSSCCVLNLVYFSRLLVELLLIQSNRL